jgi:hypothetical protein
VSERLSILTSPCFTSSPRPSASAIGKSSSVAVAAEAAAVAVAVAAEAAAVDDSTKNENDSLMAEEREVSRIMVEALTEEERIEILVVSVGKKTTRKINKIILSKSQW